jgi:hypothetical protein
MSEVSELLYYLSDTVLKWKEAVALNYTPDKCDNVHRCRVVRVSEEFHHSVHNASCDFRELDRAYVNRLDQKLPVFHILTMNESAPAN